MMDGAWAIVELRGPSAVSFTCIIFLMAYLIVLHIRVNKLEDALNKAKTDIYKSLGSDISIIKTDIRGLISFSKSQGNCMDDMKKDIRQMREFNNRK